MHTMGWTQLSQHIAIQPLKQAATQGTEQPGMGMGMAGMVHAQRPSLRSPIEDGPDASAVRAVPVHVQPGGKQDPVFHGYGAVGEGGDEELVPPWEEKTTKAAG